jgi:hypothetical protein
LDYVSIVSVVNDSISNTCTVENLIVSKVVPCKKLSVARLRDSYESVALVTRAKLLTPKISTESESKSFKYSWRQLNANILLPLSTSCIGYVLSTTLPTSTHG